MIFSFLKKKSKVNSILPQQVADLIQANSNTLFIDVREPAELAYGAAQGTVNMPTSTLSASQLPGDKSTPLIFICQSGGRSSRAAEMAGKAGYSNVFNVLGGTSAWLASNLPKK